MDEFGRLGAIFLFSFVTLHLTQQSDSQLIVNIEVSGKYVTKTGIRNYTITDWYHNVMIICSSPVSVPANISLLNNEREVIANNSASGNGIPSVKTSVNDPEGKYHCVLNVLIWVSNYSCSEFSVWSEVDIKYERRLPLCASNIGYSAYVGEKVILNCTGSYSYGYCWWRSTRTNVLEEFVSENTLGKTCSCSSYTCCSYYDYSSYSCCYNQNRHECSLSISVLQSLHLDISITLNDTRSNTSVMEFLCTSRPPRLMYWKVFGSHGDLLDFDNIDQYLNFNTTVNITQSRGTTSLRISETVRGGNGMHRVVCSTYDTEKTVVDFFRIQTPSESSSNCDKNVLEPTDMQVTTSDNPTTTLESSTLGITTQRAGHSNDGDLPSTEQGYEMKTDTINDYLLFGVVSLPYLVIILILIGIICYMNYKNRNKNKMELSTEVSAHYTPPETVLHDNPVYLAFSETKDCNPDNENEERETTYANL